MASPVVAGVVSGIAEVNAPTVAPPPGTTAGDLLICVASSTATPTTSVTGPAWVRAAIVASSVYAAVFWRVADGINDSIKLNIVATNGTYIIYRITGAGTDGIDAVGATSGGFSVPNPPGLTTTRPGTEKLFIAAAAHWVANPATGAPSGYSDLTTVGSSAQIASLSTAIKAGADDTEDPSEFTASVTRWGAFTIAVSAPPPDYLRATGVSVLSLGSGAVYSATAEARGISVLGAALAEIDTPAILAASGVSVLNPGRAGIDVPVIAVARGPSILGPTLARITPVLPDPESIAAISYTLTLTGGGGDIIVPISSWQMRRRDDGHAWLSCVAPGATPALIAAVSKRIDGNMVLRHHTHMLSGAVYNDTVLDVALSDFRYDRGTQSASITLTSSVTRHNTDPQTRPIWGETYRAMSDGVRRARLARVDPEVQPGDTVVFADGESWVVGAMTTWVGAREANMELTEAES